MGSLLLLGAGGKGTVAAIPVHLLAGFNGADGATAFNDESGAAHGAATFHGAAQLDTAQKVFGTASLLCDGSTDGVSWPDHDDWNFSNGLFTLEARVRFASTAGQQAIIAKYNGSFPAVDWIFLKFATGELVLGISTNGSGWGATQLSYAWNPVVDTWYAVACDFDGTTYRLYVDGAVVNTNTSLVTIANTGSLLSLGMTGETANSLNGWLDEVRITKGHAWYAGAYTPAVAEFPR